MSKTYATMPVSWYMEPDSMTEQQWLTCTDFAKMYAFVKDRMSMEKRELFFTLGGRIADWPSLLREIIGNPFIDIKDKLYVLRPLGMAAPGHGMRPTPMLREWLQWNNSTIPNLIHAMMNEECERCPSCGHKPHSGMCFNMASDSDCYCTHSQKFIPRAEPQWDSMPIIADALEEAGCRETAILNHLRGTEQCPHCEGLVESESRREFGNVCEYCAGCGKRPVQHVRGCWVVELLSQTL